jgi:protein-S-isoprenylcysteine O-methyltransferase Ste14
MSNGFVQRGGLWVLAQSVLLVAVTLCGVLGRGQWMILPTTLCGALLLLVAACCGIAGAITLGRNATPFPRPSAGSRLVQNGIYGLMRHPLYTAMFCGSVGWALVWQSWPALLVALILAPFFDAKVRREERWLREQFSGYADYEHRVRRFIPWIY